MKRNAVNEVGNWVSFCFWTKNKKICLTWLVQKATRSYFLCPFEFELRPCAAMALRFKFQSGILASFQGYWQITSSVSLSLLQECLKD